MSFRILALDGGGCWSLLQAMALESIFGRDTGGRDILQHFDLVAANSGGSIVLGALIADKTPAEIEALFKDKAKRESLFVLRPIWDRLPRVAGVGAKYKTSGKRAGIAAVLQATLAATPMKDLGALLPGQSGDLLKVLIFGFDYDWLRAAFYRSYDNEAGSLASDIPLADAINASSTAPVNYFDDPATWNRPGAGGDPPDLFRFWDGAVAGYNNPLLAAVVEALIAKCSPKDIQALSLGTGEVRRVPPTDRRPVGHDEFRTPRESVNLTGDIAKLATAIIDDPPDAASYIAYVVMGQGGVPNGTPDNESVDSGNVVRLNPSVQPVWEKAAGKWVSPRGLTDEQLIGLFKLDVDAIGNDDIDLIEMLGRCWLANDVPNQPVRMRLPDMTNQVGDATFQAGRDRWLAMSQSGGRTSPQASPISS